MILNLGCGERESPDGAGRSIGVDLRVTELTDVLTDLNQIPWPFKAGSFDTVLAPDIIEHLDHIIKVVDECHRVLKPMGILSIRTAAWDTAQSYTDPTHKHWFTLESFDFFDPSTTWGSKYHWYTPHKWRLITRGRDGDELLFVMRKRGSCESLLCHRV